MAKNQGGNKKRQRKSRVSSGVRKKLAGTNPGRRAAAWLSLKGGQFVRSQAVDRWPTEDQEALYFKLNTAPKKDRPEKAIKPSRSKFTMFDMALGLGPDAHKNEAVAKLLLCASMKVKKLKRAPWYRLVKTCSLGNRVLNLEV